LGKL
jgi:ferredoxin